ncbi:hypothetical protein PBCV1_a584R [Paramecium bursaria Chlorella virus 1]|uniref:Uncharacterized protein n=1 Tax=Paramecium bursaria Chlorella virus 1 TaxID=10506 RepID=O41066_PBCV1|nr:hypothetical protein PBCV1_a584R [Paramecium bursaria Chlorella virus 1]AAC97010.2 hypothetical protein [Paramecium bursaria Chlorella virus 1]
MFVRCVRSSSRYAFRFTYKSFRTSNQSRMISRGVSYFLIFPDGSNACILVDRIVVSSFKMSMLGFPTKSISNRTSVSLCFSRKSEIIFFSRRPSRCSL